MNITSPFTYNLTLRVEIVVAKLFTLQCQESCFHCNFAYINCPDVHLL